MTKRKLHIYRVLKRACQCKKKKKNRSSYTAQRREESEDVSKLKRTAEKKKKRREQWERSSRCSIPWFIKLQSHTKSLHRSLFYKCVVVWVISNFECLWLWVASQRSLFLERRCKPHPCIVVFIKWRLRRERQYPWTPIAKSVVHADKPVHTLNQMRDTHIRSDAIIELRSARSIKASHFIHSEQSALLFVNFE